MSESKYSQVRCSGGEDEEEDSSVGLNNEITPPLQSHFKKSSAEHSSNMMNHGAESSEFDSGPDGEEGGDSLRRMAPFGDDEADVEVESHIDVEDGGSEGKTEVVNGEESLPEFEILDEKKEQREGLGRQKIEDAEEEAVVEDDRGFYEDDERESEEIEIRKGSSANPNTPLITKGTIFIYNRGQWE